MAKRGKPANPPAAKSKGKGKGNKPTTVAEVIDQAAAENCLNCDEPMAGTEPGEAEICGPCVTEANAVLEEETVPQDLAAASADSDQTESFEDTRKFVPIEDDPNADLERFEESLGTIEEGPEPDVPADLEPASEQTVDTTAEVVTETPAVPVVPKPFERRHLKYSAETSKDIEGVYIAPTRYQSLQGAKDSQSGGNAIIEYDGDKPINFWLYLPDADDMCEWMNVEALFFRTVAKQAAETWALEEVAFRKKYLPQTTTPAGAAAPARRGRRAASTGDETPAAPRTRTRGSKSETSAWKTGETIDKMNPFGVSRCALLRAIGAMGITVPGAKKVMEDLGIAISPQALAYHVKSIVTTDGVMTSKTGNIPVLSEDAKAFLQPYTEIKATTVSGAAMSDPNVAKMEF